MSNRRNKPVLDYKILHTTGERVEKVAESEIDPLTLKLEHLDLSNMNTVEKLKNSEKRLCNEKEEFVLMNEVRGLGDLDYVDEYRSELLDFYRKIKNLHEKIIQEIGDTEHDKSYPSYEEKLDKLRLGVRQVDVEKVRMKKEEKEERKRNEEKEEMMRLQEKEERKRKEEKEEKMKKEKEEKEEQIRSQEREERKQEREERKRKEEKEEKMKKEKEEKEEKLRLEEKEERKRKEEKEEKLRLEEKEERKRKEEKEEQIRQQEKEERTKEREERQKREENEEKIRQEEKEQNEERAKLDAKEKEEKFFKIEEEKQVRLKKEEDEKLEFIKREKEESEEKEKLRKVLYEKECLATISLINEISLIEKTLKDTYKIDVSGLDDEQLLENKKNVVSYDQLRFKLVEKVTKLCGTIPHDYENRKEIVEKHSKIPEDMSKSHEKYVNAVSKECSSRNVSDAKLRDACGVKIELKKFSGYDSAIDIYTFQAEFDKLHLSRIPKALLPDYLKHNYLEGSALSLVKTMNDIDDIWERLKEAFGDTEVLLHNKLKEVSKFGLIWRIKDKEKLSHLLAKLVYAMIELRQLAEKHNIENNLYYGGSIETIYKIIGYKDRDKFVLKHVGSKLSKKAEWEKLTEFLQQKLKGQEKLYLIEKSAHSREEKEISKNPFKGDSSNKRSFLSDKQSLKKCYLCGETGHQVTRDHRDKDVVQYFCCKKFADLTPAERFKLLREKGLCHQCLAPGAPLDTSKHRADCYSKYCCKNKAHEKHVKKKHVLVCEEHKTYKENRELLDEYKKNCILNLKEKLPEFSRQISFHSISDLSNANTANKSNSDQTDQLESAIYVLQTIEVENEKFNLFFDSGCGDLVSKKDGVSRLEKLGRATQVRPGPIKLIGVGNQSSESKHGIYSASLPLFNGNNAVMCGVCIDNVTARFPTYPLKGKVEKDIQKAFKSKRCSVTRLPNLPSEVGGETDFMIGIKYLRYFPKEVFQLPSGLTIYESVFVNPDGSRGVVGGPHSVFTEIERRWSESNMSIRTFCHEQLELVKMGYKISLDTPLLGIKENKDVQMDHLLNAHVESGSCTIAQKSGKFFDSVENAGTEIMYRCVDCRNCTNCKKSEQIECVTIQEEVEQNIINKSVFVDVVKCETVARLPFIDNPKLKLAPNKHEALKIYEAQVRKLNKNPTDKNDVILSERKLHDLGYVAFYDDLSEEQKLMIRNSDVQYYIPWRPVWNTNSISTRCRLVLDASHRTPSGYSLNSILAKGRNNMNKLVEIAIRWLTHKYAFHTDISKMYNAVKLREEDWCYQLYLWENGLSLKMNPMIKVIMTIIYGVKSSGNQAERGIRETARKLEKEYPRAAEIVNKDIYVDDCFSGESTNEKASSTTDDLTLVLASGGFTLKGLTFSGCDPPEALSNEDGSSINVAGMKWYSKEDKISLDTKELNFGRKQRGKKPAAKNNQIPNEFTRRQCVGKVAEIFDLLGKVTPITAGFKLDLRELVYRKLDWDDKIPIDLKKLWISNFEMIKDLSNIRYQRAVIPEDAESLEVDTIDTGDASKGLACVAIYVRFKRKNGEYSCQLIFSRSKLVPQGMTQPRAELFAASLNASAGHVVKVSLGQMHKDQIKLTDSQVALHWISNEKGVLKQWVRNTVIEINRLADRKLWRYVHTKNMSADLGTRKGASLKDIDSDSAWINGLDWMRKDNSQFPVLTVEEVKLDPGKLSDLKDEYLKGNSTDLIWSEVLNKGFMSKSNHAKSVSKELEKRYMFSNYVIDPNKFRLRKVVRILAMVKLFINNVRKMVRIRKGIQSNHNEEVIVQETVKNIPVDFINDKYVVTVGKSHKVGKDATIQCKPGLVINLSENDIAEAFNYFYRKATLEVQHFLSVNLYEKISEVHDGILYYKGRILATQKVAGRKTMSDVMIDLSGGTFHVPITDSLSPFAYSIVNEVHWYNEDAMHSGIETVLRYTQKFAHIIEGRELVKKFKRSCQRCRVLDKRSVEVSMGPVKECNMLIAPAFLATQVDLCGPFSSFSNHNKRATVNIWFVVFCCCTTGAVSIKVMDDYSTSSFLLAFIRFSSVHGYPKFLLPDEGSQLVKGCKTMQLSFVDVQHRLNTEYGIQFETCPVGGHNMHGKVERKIRQVQESIRKKLHGDRLSILQWETLGDQIANNVNNLPLASVSVSADLENLDILTPNRLLLGRNNDRCPSGPLLVTQDLQKVLEANIEIFTVWFECWLVSYVPRLMKHPKWFQSDRDVKTGDIVLFLRTEKEYSRQYQYGMVKSVEKGSDGKIRTVIVRYRNPSEKKDRETRRAVRELVIIHHVDELFIFEELADAARTVQLAYLDS